MHSLTCPLNTSAFSPYIQAHPVMHTSHILHRLIHPSVSRPISSTRTPHSLHCPLSQTLHPLAHPSLSHTFPSPLTPITHPLTPSPSLLHPLHYHHFRPLKPLCQHNMWVISRSPQTSSFHHSPFYTPYPLYASSLLPPF